MKNMFLILILLTSFYIKPAMAESTVLATLNDSKITEDEVLKEASTRMIKLLSQMYDIKRDAIDSIIDQRLLEAEAKTKGLTPEKLEDQIKSKAAKSTEKEAEAYYNSQKRRFKDKTFDDVKKQLMAQLDIQNQYEELNKFYQSLRDKAKISYLLERPRVEIKPTNDDPFIGKQGAPIVLIEFSEYQCPFCKKARPTIDKILSTYGDKVFYQFHDFPLSFHAQAKGAANAANCANDQGQYWPYSRKLWEVQGQQTDEKLVSIAKDVKLDMGKFETCMKDKKYYSEITDDIKMGSDYGVSGTPAYFINGLFLSGAQPFESFKKLIDEELDRLKVKTN